MFYFQIKVWQVDSEPTIKNWKLLTELNHRLVNFSFIIPGLWHMQYPWLGENMQANERWAQSVYRCCIIFQGKVQKVFLICFVCFCIYDLEIFLAGVSYSSQDTNLFSQSKWNKCYKLVIKVYHQKKGNVRKHEFCRKCEMHMCLKIRVLCTYIQGQGRAGLL